MSDPSKREEKLQGLRDLVDFLSDHDEFPLPYSLAGDHEIWMYGQDEMLRLRKQMGHVEKILDDYKFGFSRHFGPIELQICVGRSDVCERVEVGTRVVAAVPERTVPVYEYKCPESFLVKLGEESGDSQ